MLTGKNFGAFKAQISTINAVEDYYKKISEKYKVGKRDGRGREYLLKTKIFIFEGEYINFKRNGKGKKFNYNGDLEFEGEYLNGKRNGKGREYYNNGNLEFEGEYLNGERNGKGREYYSNGNLEFEGEYLNGKRWNGKNIMKKRILSLT